MKLYERQTKTVLTEQAYTKIFGIGKGSTYKRKNIYLQDAESLYDWSSKVISFQNSLFKSEIIVSLREQISFEKCRPVVW